MSTIQSAETVITRTFELNLYQLLKHDIFCNLQLQKLCTNFGC